MNLEIILPPDDDIDDNGNYIGNDPVFLNQESNMNIKKISNIEEFLKNAIPIDIESFQQRIQENIKEEKRQLEEKIRLENIRIDEIECPFCKSTEKHHHIKRSNNGVIGSGYHSYITEEYYVCLKCGIHYSDLNKK